MSFPLLATPLDFLLTQLYLLARRACRWFRSQQLAIHQSPRITQTPWIQCSAAQKPHVHPLSLPLPPFHTGSPLLFLFLPTQQQSYRRSDLLSYRWSDLLLSRPLCPYLRLNVRYHRQLIRKLSLCRIRPVTSEDLAQQWLFSFQHRLFAYSL